MNKYEKVKKEIEEEILTEVQCDVCKESAIINENGSVKYQEDWIFSGEMKHISFYGGYGSVFGDMKKVEIDICDKCFKEKLGEFVRIVDTEESF